MGRLHSKVLMQLFPEIKGFGIDLANRIEFKETLGLVEKYELKPSDSKAQYFVFFNTRKYLFILVDGCSIPLVRERRSFTQAQIERVSMFSTTDPYELIDYMKRNEIYG